MPPLNVSTIATIVTPMGRLMWDVPPGRTVCPIRKAYSTRNAVQAIGQ